MIIRVVFYYAGLLNQIITNIEMIMTAYYNEFDPKAAAWLRELIKLKLIADGEVDERSITDVHADDLRGFTQCHFFAGIGGWSYALKLAGVSDDYPLWTASLPCQPFSSAGKQLGKDDERHLLPHFLELVRQCKPNVIFGEQVEGAIKHGWLDDLQTNMEAENYAVGHCVLGAHSVGAFHQRQRLYWVANSKSDRWNKRVSNNKWCDERNKTERSNRRATERSDSYGELPNASSSRLQGCGEFGELDVPQGRKEANRQNSISSLWRDVRWIECRDGKQRAIEPSTKPLVNGFSERMVRSGDNSVEIDYNNTQEARVMRLKGYGNAIVPQVAALFISSFFEVLE